MHTTTYRCDRCGAEDQDNNIKLENVGVYVGRYEAYRPFSTKGEKVQFNKEWCLECRIKSGLTNPDFDKSVTPNPEPITLEELVREIAYDAACEALQGQS